MKREDLKKTKNMKTSPQKKLTEPEVSHSPPKKNDGPKNESLLGG